jgi:ParB family chromosome partitioning protein
MDEGTAIADQLRKVIKTKVGNKKAESDVLVDIGKIDQNPNQPRKQLHGIEKLSLSIYRTGLIEPVVVKRKDNGRYELVAGHRRLAAYKILAAKDSKFSKIKVAFSDKKASENSLLEAMVENIAREDMSPLDIAEALDEAKRKLKCTTRDLEEYTTLSKSAIDRYLQLATFDTRIKEAIRAKNIEKMTELYKILKLKTVQEQLAMINGESKDKIIEEVSTCSISSKPGVFKINYKNISTIQQEKVSQVLKETEEKINAIVNDKQ